MHQTILNLDANAVAAPAQQAAVTAAHVIAECVNRIAGRELHEPMLQGARPNWPRRLRLGGSSASQGAR
jgi:hypothetical protein